VTIRLKSNALFIAAIALAAGSLAQEAPAPKPPELSVISARLGTCSADFIVTDADGKPIYAAMVHVRIKYGFLGLKRMDLEVGTNSDGKARVEGLPLNNRPLTYDIAKADKKATAEQNVSTNCRATYELSLK
jgi:hypothetical protein